MRLQQAQKHLLPVSEVMAGLTEQHEIAVLPASRRERHAYFMYCLLGTLKPPLWRGVSIQQVRVPEDAAIAGHQRVNARRVPPAVPVELPAVLVVVRDPWPVVGLVEADCDAIVRTGDHERDVDAGDEPLQAAQDLVRKLLTLDDVASGVDDVEQLTQIPFGDCGLLDHGGRLPFTTSLRRVETRPMYDDLRIASGGSCDDRGDEGRHRRQRPEGSRP